MALPKDDRDLVTDLCHTFFEEVFNEAADEEVEIEVEEILQELSKLLHYNDRILMLQSQRKIRELIVSLYVKAMQS